jgi:hypothetical protein
MKEYIRAMANGEYLLAAGILAGDIVDDISRDLSGDLPLKEIEPVIIELAANVGCALLGIAFLHSDPKSDDHQLKVACKRVRKFANLQRHLRELESN